MKKTSLLPVMCMKCEGRITEYKQSSSGRILCMECAPSKVQLTPATPTPTTAIGGLNAGSFCSTPDRYNTHYSQMFGLCRHCKLQVNRRFISEHEQGCAQRPVLCKYSKFGCTWSGLNKDTSHHKCTASLTLAMNEFRKQAATMGKLEQFKEDMFEVESLDEPTAKGTVLFELDCKRSPGTFYGPYFNKISPFGRHIAITYGVNLVQGTTQPKSFYFGFEKIRNVNIDRMRLAVLFFGIKNEVELDGVIFKDLLLSNDENRTSLYTLPIKLECIADVFKKKTFRTGVKFYLMKEDSFEPGPCQSEMEFGDDC